MIKKKIKYVTDYGLECNSYQSAIVSEYMREVILKQTGKTTSMEIQKAISIVADLEYDYDDSVLFDMIKNLKNLTIESMQEIKKRTIDNSYE